MRSRVRLHASAACIAVAAGSIALIAKARLFPLMSGDADESVYIYQGRMLAGGHTTLAADVHATFFHPWLFGARGDTLFSQYQPGWPTVIALGRVLGNEQVALVVAACAAALATWWLAREVAPRAAPYAAVLFLIAPIFVIHSALYLSYIWTTALVTGGTAAALAGLRTGRRLLYVASGALFGVAQLTRPLDALLVFGLVAIFLAVSRWGQWASLMRIAGWIAVGLVPFVFVTLMYNAHITGGPLHFPLQAAEELDTFGFGPRRMAATEPTLDYTRSVAWRAFRENTNLIPRWFAGGYLGLALALAAVVVHRRRREAWLLVAWVAVFPVAYIFWWATTLAAEAGGGLGPHYYVPIFAPLSILAGWFVSDVVRRSRWLGVAAFGAALLVTAAFLLPDVFDNARFTTDIQEAKHEPFDTTDPEDAVVVLRADPSPYLFVNETFLIGNPDLTGDRIYAVDRGPETADLQDGFPDRDLYQYVLRAEPGDELLEPTYVLEPLEITRGATVTLRYDITNTTGQTHVLASVHVGDRRAAMQALDDTSTTGEMLRLDVVLIAPGAARPAPRPGLLVAEVGQDETVETVVGFGPGTDFDYADLFARRYFVARRGDELVVQQPGLHFHLYRSGDGEVWAAENVGPHLQER